MAKDGQTFEQWLRGARIQREQLSDQQRAILHATFQFLQHDGGDYSSSRIASYYLLHCGVGLKVAQIARLIGISTRSVFRHENLSARQVAQQIQHRFNGRPYGKLLPRMPAPSPSFSSPVPRPRATSCSTSSGGRGTS